MVFTNYVKKYADAARPDQTVEVLGKDYDPASVTDAQITVTTVLLHALTSLPLL